MFQASLRSAARRLARASSGASATTAAASAAASGQRAAHAAGLGEADTRVMAYALGALSVLPFAALTPYGHAQLTALLASAGGAPLPLSPADVGRLQILYGSSVLSFLGAVHWGLALAGPSPPGLPLANVVRLGWGVAPSLFAVPVPALRDGDARRVLATSLGASLVADAAFARMRLLPRWYLLHLRLPLTLVAIASLAAGGGGGATAAAGRPADDKGGAAAR